MGMPLDAVGVHRDAHAEFGYSSYEVEQPHHDDLASSRLQAKLAGLSRDLWNSIADPQRLRMLESKRGGAKKEVLRRFANALQGDVFALEQLTSDSRVFPVLKRLSGGPDSELLSGTWQNMTKVVDKVNLHYSYLDSYMSDPDYVADNGKRKDKRNLWMSLPNTSDHSQPQLWKITRGPLSSPDPLRRHRCRPPCNSCTT